MVFAKLIYMNIVYVYNARTVPNAQCMVGNQSHCKSDALPNSC